MNFGNIIRQARKTRKDYGISSYGIGNIFDLVARHNCKVLRFPFGPNVLEGMALEHDGDKIVVTNSSKIYVREVFTAAHELAHIIFDINGEEKRIIDTSEDLESSDDIEKRARIFAANLLCPEAELREFVSHELEKGDDPINGYDVVRIQCEFCISYDTALNRLLHCRIITDQKKMDLKAEQTIYTSTELFNRLGASTSIINASETISIPPEFVDWVVGNYSNGIIPYTSLEYALSSVKIDASPFRMLAKSIPDECDVDIDAILRDYSNEGFD